MDIITIKDMLAQMSTGTPFSIEYWTYDRKRDTGGELRTYDEAELMMQKKSKNSDRKPTELEAAQKSKSKQPNHRHFYTRNIRILADGHQTTVIKKIHPLLVDKFNEKTVTL